MPNKIKTDYYCRNQERQKETGEGMIREHVRYLTDDRDATRRNELILGQADNGDWYIATVPEGEFGVGKFVRLCTSGGASSRCPGLTVAIAGAYNAISKGGA